MGKRVNSSLNPEVATAVLAAVETALAAVLKPAPARKQEKRPAAPPPRKAITKAAKELPRDRHGFRGVPPPAEFDLYALPATSWLTEAETAAVTRLAISTLAAWRQRPNPPLKCMKVRDRRVRYQVGEVRQFLAGGERPRRGRPRKKPAPAPSAAPAPRRQARRPRVADTASREAAE
jgi:hypothetical protein